MVIADAGGRESEPAHRTHRETLKSVAPAPASPVSRQSYRSCSVQNVDRAVDVVQRNRHLEFRWERVPARPFARLLFDLQARVRNRTGSEPCCYGPLRPKSSGFDEHLDINRPRRQPPGVRRRRRVSLTIPRVLLCVLNKSGEYSRGYVTIVGVPTREAPRTCLAVNPSGWSCGGSRQLWPGTRYASLRWVDGDSVLAVRALRCGLARQTRRVQVSGRGTPQWGTSWCYPATAQCGPRRSGRPNDRLPGLRPSSSREAWLLTWPAARVGVPGYAARRSLFSACLVPAALSILGRKELVIMPV